MQTDDVLKDQRVLKKSKNKIQFRFISIVLIKSSNSDLFLGNMKLVFEIFLLIVCMFQFISRKKNYFCYLDMQKRKDLANICHLTSQNLFSLPSIFSV